MDIQIFIALVLLGGTLVKGLTVLRSFWEGEHAKKAYQNTRAAGLSSKWASRLVQTTHVAVLWVPRQSRLS